MTPGVSGLEEDLDNNVVCSWMVWGLKNRTSIHPAKYADDVILLAKEETVLQGMADRLVEVGWHYGMEMNVEMTQWKSQNHHTNPHIQIMRDQKQLENGECFI